MSLQEIIENETEIFECAKAFRQDANNLMYELAKVSTSGLPTTEFVAKEIYDHKYNNKGLFRDDWTYYFHGAECRFDNLKTGQIVELIYITQPEFGFLDGYFFFNYLATTDRFKKLTGVLTDSSKTWAAIEALADKGILKRDLSVTIKRNIIAR